MQIEGGLLEPMKLLKSQTTRTKSNRLRHAVCVMHLNEHHCGAMTEICKHCHALYWKLEANTRGSYVLCCHGAFVDLTITIKPGGEKNCSSNHFNSGPKCYVSCDEKQGKWHSCDINGKWSPKLPKCATAGSGQKLVPRPHFIRQYEPLSDHREYYDQSDYWNKEYHQSSQQSYNSYEYHQSSQQSYSSYEYEQPSHNHDNSDESSQQSNGSDEKDEPSSSKRYSYYEENQETCECKCKSGRTDHGDLKKNIQKPQIGVVSSESLSHVDPFPLDPFLLDPYPH